MNRLGFPPVSDERAGLNAARVVRTRYAMKKNMGMGAEDFAATQPWDFADREHVAMLAKTAVGGSDLSDVVGQRGSVSFSPTLATRSVIDFALQHGATTVPFYTKLIASGQVATAAWVGRGKAIRMSKLDLQGTAMLPKAIGALTVATNESLEDSDPRTEATLGRDLTNASDKAVNEAALDAYNAGDTHTPPGLNYGQLILDSAGSGIAEIAHDFHAALRELSDLGSDLANVIAVVHSRTAANLSTMRTTEGGVPFPGMTPKGGEIFGLPCAATAAMPNEGSPTETCVILVDASDIVIADDGARPSLSDATSIEMSDAPTGNATTPTAASATIVSMFEAEATAIKIVRRVNWKLRRGLIVTVGGVAY